MAPEVRRYFLGEEVQYDWSADLWSLGAVAVAMLTGNIEPRVATRPCEYFNYVPIYLKIKALTFLFSG